MSGVFGFVAPDQDTRGLANEIARVMAHCSWHIAEYISESNCAVGLGRIGIGIFNKTAQPVWNATRTIALMMAGEFYDTPLTPPNAASGSDEQLALLCYEREGINFARSLNGAFVIAIWDRLRQLLIVTNDRFGLYPHYFACRHGHFIFAPEVKGVFCDAAIPRELDWTALAQYMRFQHLLGERTFFQAVQLLPPASVLVFDQSTATIQMKAYWSLEEIPYRPQVTFPEAVEQTGYLLRRAVHRLSGDPLRAGVYLSGGLDSRTILGLIASKPAVSINYGHRNSRDVYYAEQIARAVKSDHHWCELSDGNWVKEYANLHLELTEGFHSWIHAHGISTLSCARQLMDVNLTGWDGGTIMGHSDNIEPLQISPVDTDALVVRLFTLFNQHFTWPSINEAEENLLYCEPLQKQMRGLAFDSFREEVLRFLKYRPDIRSEFFYIRNHCARLTQNLVTFTRSHVEVRFPFFDYDLFDFLYSLPASLRGHRILYRSVIQQQLPCLARIPYAQDELLPTTNPLLRNSHAVIIKIFHRLNRYWGTIFPGRYTLYADYENYLRGELREWAEGILYDRRTVERGIFDPAFVRSLMERHLSGRELWTIGKIAPIMEYEMLLRRFLG